MIILHEALRRFCQGDGTGYIMTASIQPHMGLLKSILIGIMQHIYVFSIIFLSHCSIIYFIHSTFTELYLFTSVYVFATKYKTKINNNCNSRNANTMLQVYKQCKLAI